MYPAKSILSACLLFAMQSAMGLPEDIYKTMYVTSDSTTYNHKTGYATYLGHVHITQGSTRILADKLVTKSNARHHMQEAIAYGLKKPAHYWTLPKIGDTELHASAMIIKLFPSQSSVTLEQNAVLIQHDNHFQGQFIVYNRSDQTVFVPASQQGHAVVVYDPDDKM